MRVLVTSDYRALSLQAAQIVAEAVCLKPDLVLCLPTGNTPLGMYEELVRRHRQEGLDFSRVRTFNLDESSSSAGTWTYVFSGPVKNNTTIYATCTVQAS